ncbi:MAG: sugar ABC transporter ATP-binding protein [Treponema sp.]|jgi:ABC-type sugar transport system ATPase subunit|nr:sugar ABC transporter ATP-binding protein [Treponema sp.]
MPESILAMKHINKSFPGVRVLEDVNLSVHRGEVHCLIGANGAGKSTLMKILAGAYQRDGGEIIFNGESIKEASPILTRKKGISVVYQELSLVNELTVAENILLNNLPGKNFKIDWRTAARLAGQYIDQLSVAINPKMPAGELSIGSRQLVEIMKCLAANSKLIVMDEPSATLSKDEFNTLMRIINALRRQDITIIYISHRLEELFAIGDRVSVLKDGKNVITKNISETNIDELVEYMIGYKLTANPRKSGGEERTDSLLEARHFVTAKLKDVSINLHEKEIVGLYGLVGSGRTEFLRAVYGVDRLQSGELYICGKKSATRSARRSIKNGIGMLPENRKMQGLVLKLPVWQNICMVALKKFRGRTGLNYRRIREESRRYIRDLDIKTPSEMFQTVYLSGGNQQKIILAKWLMQNSKVLLVDEPTQGIDVKAKSEIYKILRQTADQGHGIIMASGELEELTNICDRIFVMFQGRIAAEFEKKEFEDSVILQYAVAGK